MPPLPPSPRSLLSRRGLLSRLLTNTAGLSALSALSPMLQRAHGSSTLADQYYIFCYFEGGWDLLLGLDPRDPYVFRDDLKKVTRIQTGYSEQGASDQLPIPTSVPGMTFGPYIGDLAAHAADLCVVRGMSMDTLTHEVGRRRFITGHAPAGLQAKGSAASTVLAGWLSQGEPIPQLSVKVESYNTDQPGFASAIKVSSVDDLVRALRRSGYEPEGAVQAELDAFLADYAACGSTARSRFRRDALSFRQGSKDLVARGLDSRFDFGAETDDMAALRDRYGIDPADLTSGAAQSAAAVTALFNGISRVVCIEPCGDLDTHGPEWADSHGDSLRSGFNLMAAMLSDLKNTEYKDTGESWLSRTTVVAFSEFGRTPLINSSGGRDHYLHNACLLAGGGVRGGTVIGASSDIGMAPQPVDLQSGALDPAGTTLRPENIWRALQVRAGITDDVTDLGAEPLSALYG